jgi:hypothetical protein
VMVRGTDPLFPFHAVAWAISIHECAAVSLL